jgi:hypothetical protein
MTIQPVEWVLIIYYGSSAHRATYGRLGGTKYTQDYIQLSRKDEFLDTVSRLFPVAGGEGSVPLTYQWPAGSTPGAFVFKSADRPHLKWETSLGAPKAWKMSVTPSDSVAETIPGDPSHLDFTAAENELALLASRGAGQPYLLAIKLRDEQNKLHLRAYLDDASSEFDWAALKLVPKEIQVLASRTSASSALAWGTFQGGGFAPTSKIVEVLNQLQTAVDPATVVSHLDADAARALGNYLRQPGYGLFFDPKRNHDAWIQTAPLPTKVSDSAGSILLALDARFPPVPQGDAAAEALESDPAEVESFRHQIERASFEVPDATATVKTRGSAQRAFADAVKSNYGMRCGLTGISTREFLVAAHIVPWSKDQSIRLDPKNGICLSLLVDRAFECGFLLIEDDYTVRLNIDRLGHDNALREQLQKYDGVTLNVPTAGAPKVEYLRRKRLLIRPEE